MDIRTNEDRQAFDLPIERFDWKEVLASALGGYFPQQVPMEFVIDQAKKGTRDQ